MPSEIGIDGPRMAASLSQANEPDAKTSAHPPFAGGVAMPIYILRGRYSSEALKGMIASPEDREAAISKVVEKAGGKLLSYYVTFGEDDWLVIMDCPNDEVALTIAIV